ncbi:MAG TPA: hypothetical protein VGG28_32190 [Kofleriaceae bacterium]|jgi:hypothetical protein
MAEYPAPKRDEGEDTERERRTTTPPAGNQDDDTRVAFTSWDAPLIPR